MMRKSIFIIIGLALLGVIYLFYTTNNQLSKGEVVVESTQVCDPHEVTKMPETFN